MANQSGTTHLDITDLCSGDESKPVLTRRAVKAVVVSGDHLLLIRSVNGDFKFVGGGVESGESPMTALVREVAEECALIVERVGDCLVSVRERRQAVEVGHVFEMVSEYHLVDLADESAVEGGPVLDDYERHLQLTPVMVDPRVALTVNQRLIAAWTDEEISERAPWIHRETRVLMALRRRGLFEG